MSNTVSTEKAPKAIGPYSQAVCTGSLVFTSGQIALDPGTGALVKGGIAEQTRQVCGNIKAVLEAAGCTMEDVVKTTCFLSDMSDFVVFNEVYAGFFTGSPARSCVAVKSLPKGALVEVEAVAEKHV